MDEIKADNLRPISNDRLIDLLGLIPIVTLTASQDAYNRMQSDDGTLAQTAIDKLDD